MQLQLPTFVALALATTCLAAGHDDAHSHHRRADRASNVISVPLTRAEPSHLQGRDANPLGHIQAQIQHLGKKYASNFAAYKDNHEGKRNPMQRPGASVPAWTISATNATVPKNCTELRRPASASTSDDAESSGELQARSISGTLSVTPQSDYSYWTGYMNFGSKSTSVKVSFDTGSSDLVLNLNQGYSPSSSKSAKNTGKDFTVGYADGSMSHGIIYNETVSVAGKTAYGQAIGVPTASTFSASDPGIVGMAFQSVSGFNRRPLLQTLRRYDSIPRAMFGVALSRTASKAEMRIGGYNPSKIKSGSSLAWTNIDRSSGFWTVPSSKMTMAFNGKSGSITSARELILDTGTTLIFASVADAKALYKANGLTASEQGDYTVGIYSGSTPPTMSFTIGGKAYKLSGAAMSAGSAGNNKGYVAVVGCDSFGLEAGQWLIGDSWFAKMYTVFDADNYRVGIAPGNF